MAALFHSIAGLSIRVIGAVGVAAATTVAFAGTVAPGADQSSPYYGRWTVSEDRPAFTPRGRLYKTIDIAPCGRDFCGVTVNDRGACGVTLFRFLASHKDGTTTLRGHGRWGAERKNVQIDTWETDDGQAINLYLGDGYDFGERSENMPRFHGEYRRLGQARCIAG
ncbi:MAG TPA: hypothetical protein VHG29_12790 [Novosphingobium sp.]|nr:hypothetical protein [Novosphingobium sp.]